MKNQILFSHSPMSPVYTVYNKSKGERQMSEFSESYHIRKGTLDDAMLLIQQSNQPGYVGMFNENWSTLVPESAICSWEADIRIIQNNTGLMIHYSWPEDWGFMFELYNASQLVSLYSFEFEELDEEQPDISLANLNSADFIRLLELDINPAELEAMLAPDDFGEIFSIPDKLMALLGVDGRAYNWISYHYCELLENEDPQYGFTKV